MLITRKKKKKTDSSVTIDCEIIVLNDNIKNRHLEFQQFFFNLK